MYVHVCRCCHCACSNGDVAWEAQASTGCLAQAGLKWDQQTQSIIRDTSSSNTGTQQQDSASTSAADRMDAAAMAAAPTTAAAAEASAGIEDSGSPGSTGEAKHNNRSAAPADAPAGEEQDAAAAPGATNPVATLAAAAALAQAVASSAAPAGSVSTANGLRGIIPAATGSSSGSSNGGSTGVRHVKISTAQPTTLTYDASASGAGGGGSSTQPVRDAKALLLQLFADFPTACLDMIQTTEASTILEGPVLTRAARQMPACMGRGSVMILGEAAHPMRPSGECVAGDTMHVPGTRCNSSTAGTHTYLFGNRHSVGILS